MRWARRRAARFESEALAARKRDEEAHAREEFEAQQRLSERLAAEEEAAKRLENSLLAQEALAAEKRKAARLAEEKRTLSDVEQSRRGTAKRRETERLRALEDLVREEDAAFRAEKVRLEKELGRSFKESEERLIAELSQEEQAMRQRLVARINHAREALRRQQALESAELSVAQPAPETAEPQADFVRILSLAPPRVIGRELASKTVVDAMRLIDESAPPVQMLILSALEEPLKSILSQAMADSGDTRVLTADRPGGRG